jgi:hypothetical protein
MFVRRGEGVDAVVVWCVGEGGELVEEFAAVGSADEFDEAVFGCCSDVAGADVFGAGWAFAADGVAAQDVALVAVGERFSGGARFLLDEDGDVVAIALGGGGDELFDGAGGDADADDVGDVEVGAVAVEFKFDADRVVGVRGGAAGGCGC